VELGPGAAILAVMIEDVVDCDEHLAGDCGEGSADVSGSNPFF
jgi:hypothetical protein